MAPGEEVSSQSDIDAWVCPQCHEENSLAREDCTICGAWRPATSDVPTRSLSPPSPPLSLSSGSSQLDSGSAVGSVGPWACSACLADNEEGDEQCAVCGAPKASAEVGQQGTVSVPSQQVGGRRLLSLSPSPARCCPQSSRAEDADAKLGGGRGADSARWGPITSQISHCGTALWHKACAVSDIDLPLLSPTSNLFVSGLLRFRCGGAFPT